MTSLNWERVTITVFVVGLMLVGLIMIGIGHHLRTAPAVQPHALVQNHATGPAVVVRPEKFFDHKKPIYRRVLPGGKLDGAIDCKAVPPVARSVPPEVVEQYARQYGVSEEAITKLRLCL